MSQNQTFNNATYSIPVQGDVKWAPPLTRYLAALGTYTFSPAGGARPLTASLDLSGNGFGVLADYFSGPSAGIASQGRFRMTSAGKVAWRNNAGGGDNILATDASDNITWNGSIIPVGLNTLADGKMWIGNGSNVPTAQTLTGDVTVTDAGVTAIGSNKIVNAQINSAAAIAYSKLNLTGSVVNSDIGASASIAYSKLALSNSILNADINSSAAIAYSKLSLTGSILNADINSSAAIAYSKLALTGSILNADINSSAAIAYSKLALTGSVLNADIASGAAIAVNKLAAVTANRVLLSDSSGFVSASTVTNTTLGYLDATSSVQTQLNSISTVANAALPSSSFTDAGITSKLLTGYTSGAGTVASTDTILQGIQKLNGNDALKLPLAGGTLTGALLLASGSASAPSAAFAAATDTGVYRNVLPTVGAAAANWNTTTHNVTATAHGLPMGTVGQLTTSGGLPAGLSLATNYYVIVVDDNTFALATTLLNANTGIKIAFTTQGTGTHTFTSTATKEVGIAAGGAAMLRLTPTTLFVGGSKTATQATEVLHAEQGTSGGGFDAADIVVNNSSTGAARFIASSGGASGPLLLNVQAYLTAFGSTNSGTYWTSGPNVANSSTLQFDHITDATAPTVFQFTGVHSKDVYFWNSGTHGEYHFGHGSGFTEDFRVSDLGMVAYNNIAFGSTSVGLTGTTGANAAPAGAVGQVIESKVTTAASAPSNGQYGDLTHIDLTAGRWRIDAFVVAELNGATQTYAGAGVSTTTGNSGTGLTYGDTFGDIVTPTSAYSPSIGIPGIMVSLSGTTTYYLKMIANYSAGTPKFAGRITATRIY